MARIETGSWRALDAAELNTAALALGPDQNVLSSGEPAAPQFMDFMPPDFLESGHGILPVGGQMSPG